VQGAFAEQPLAGEEGFMSGSVPVLWILVGFNALFLLAFFYRRIRSRPPLTRSLSYLAQGVFIAVNCLFLFQDDVQRYFNWLTGAY
jgi:hypothetical protein